MPTRLLKPLEPMARGLLRAASPRHRRWHDLLRGCSLDPAEVTEMDEPGPRDVVICGCPRSGTALATAALHQPPVMHTVMEPWSGLRRPPAELFADIRAELATGTLRQGRLRLDVLATEGRVAWQRDGERSFPVESFGDGLVGIKWPSYWQLLGRLRTTRFVVCVRHPADVVASMATTGGRLADGLDYDTTFTRALNRRLLIDAATADERRLAMYDAVYSHVLDHAHQPNVFLLHYERWHSEPEVVLADLGLFLGADLGRNRALIGAAPEPRSDRSAVATRSRTARALGYT